MVEKQKILIVDDEPKNTKLMKAMLMPEGYDLFDALSGEEALGAVSDSRPDLILMDVMMPGMDGFEACRRIKGQDETKAIPILMVTALREQVHRVKAMEAGADDFLSKPVDRTELLIRVKSLLRIKRYHDDLLESYMEIAEKNRKLQELEEAKEGLIHMIIHDLKNPLTGVMGLIELALLSGQDRHREKPFINLMRGIDYCKEMNDQIENLLLIHRMEKASLSIEKSPTSIHDLVRGVLEQVRVKAESKGVALSFAVQGDIPAVSVDRELIKRAIANMVNNAIRHTPGKKGVIEGSVLFSGERLRVHVKDNGDGLAAEYHEKIFNKFEQAKLKRKGVSVGSTGLGLTFCKMVVEAHGGKIWVESEGEGKGCTFGFEIPVAGSPTTPA